MSVSGHKTPKHHFSCSAPSHSFIGLQYQPSSTVTPQPRCFTQPEPLTHSATTPPPPVKIIQHLWNNEAFRCWGKAALSPSHEALVLWKCCKRAAVAVAFVSELLPSDRNAFPVRMLFG